MNIYTAEEVDNLKKQQLNELNNTNYTYVITNNNSKTYNTDIKFDKKHIQDSLKYLKHMTNEYNKSFLYKFENNIQPKIRKLEREIEKLNNELEKMKILEQLQGDLIKARQIVLSNRDASVELKEYENRILARPIFTAKRSYSTYKSNDDVL
jgi:hypothetical protein